MRPERQGRGLTDWDALRHHILPIVPIRLIRLCSKSSSSLGHFRSISPFWSPLSPKWRKTKKNLAQCSPSFPHILLYFYPLAALPFTFVSCPFFSYHVYHYFSSTYQDFVLLFTTSFVILYFRDFELGLFHYVPSVHLLTVTHLALLPQRTTPESIPGTGRNILYPSDISINISDTPLDSPALSSSHSFNQPAAFEQLCMDCLM